MTPFGNGHISFWRLEMIREGSNRVLKAAAVGIFTEALGAGMNLGFFLFFVGDVEWEGLDGPARETRCCSLSSTAEW
jgi:hypothetical protein